MSRFHQIVQTLGLDGDDFPWLPQDDGTVIDQRGRPVCVLGDPFAALEPKDLENFALILTAPFLRGLVVGLATRLVLERGMEIPDWLAGLDENQDEFTTVLGQAERAFALLDQHA
ncbi:hypothetical protein [Phenylobacterium sp. 58.2.17]|uniref:hypothetical protein n=1 Tax=Phenylobacterium sp. 58.2.17 TaxID=2969306 RepID=UPI002264B95A|nr:hypothetical protein [Phenylobacterium sp. 58.2.17]MCX7586571.1 hypothetical protein [Phenylobacterium sp. 58.2.17]